MTAIALNESRPVIRAEITLGRTVCEIINDATSCPLSMRARVAAGLIESRVTEAYEGAPC